MARYEVGYDGLDALLQELPENTAETPYEIELTEVTAEFLRGAVTPIVGTLQYVLKQNHTYVSLSFGSGCDDVLESLASAAYMFTSCTSLTSVDVSGMTAVTNAPYMFTNCTSLTSVDVSGMTAVTNAPSMFTNCTSLTTVDVSSMSSVTDVGYMFYSCTSLEKIHGWQIPLTARMTNCFSGCTSLRFVYVPERTPKESSSWHVWDVRKDTANSRSTVRIYSEDGSYVSANVPSGDSWSMEIPGKTDELYFSAGSSITQEHMQKMLATRVPVTSKSGVLDPARDNFVLMAKDPDSVKTNITKAVFDTVHPIGSTYIQFPGCPSPNELWGSMSVWTELNFNGAFFRASGTNASAFGSGEQGDLVKNHTHNMNHIHDRGNMEINGYIGSVVSANEAIVAGASFSRTFHWDSTKGTGSSGWSLHGNSIDFFASRTWSGYTGGTRNPDWNNPFDKLNTEGNDPNGIENRPRNYTVRIWKRTP